MRKLIVGWNVGVLLENFGYGSAVLISLKKHWNEESKKPHRTNEILYAILFYVFGICSLFLFEGDGLSYKTENNLYFMMFIIFLSMDAFWWLSNFLPSHIKCKNDPEELKRRDHNEFIKNIKENQAGANIKGDITRKLLHVIMFSIIVVVYILTSSNRSIIELYFENYISFTKFLYITTAYIFVYMFTLADVVRHNKFHLLPNWARKWFGTSLEPREINTFISSIPYIQTLSLFIFAPFQLLFIASGISTFADGAASIIGKRFGKHKFPQKLDSKKSYEGLLAGTFAAFLSSMVILLLFPFPNQTYLFIFLASSLNALIFACLDLFVRKVADNITNVLFPGLCTLLLAQILL